MKTLTVAISEIGDSLRQLFPLGNVVLISTNLEVLFESIYGARGYFHFRKIDRTCFTATCFSLLVQSLYKRLGVDTYFF
jgi:hypothetical protein